MKMDKIKYRKIIFHGRLQVFFAFCICFFFACSEQPSVKVENLRCELLKNPVGIDCPNPRLGWEISGNFRGIRQTAYHILEASSLEKLNVGEGDIWNSKQVKSDKFVHVKYYGKPLVSRSVRFWKVKVFTNQGTTEWSQPAQWSMSFVGENDWQAKWTGLDRSFTGDVLKGKTRLAARYFRKEFNTDKDIRKATLYISGFGLYQAYINGNRIGETGLFPVSTFHTTVHTVRYTAVPKFMPPLSDNSP